MRDLSRVQVAGPLERYAPGFVVELVGVGYTRNSAAFQLQLMAHVSRWLEANDLDAGALSVDTVERFLAARRAAGYTNYVSGRAMAPLLEYLRRIGVVPAALPEVPGTPAELLLARYGEYLSVERGLAAGTVWDYVHAVRPFLAAQGADGELDLERLSAGEVTAFVVARCPGQARGSAKLTVTALRSLLRFLHVEGVIPGSLVGAVPSAASWRLSGLPRALEPGQVELLLDSCDRCTTAGRRDFAVLTVLVRLALRAGEVAGLCLDDVDWHAGELVVLGKGRRAERLPLPVDVGEAITGYLRAGRPASAQDRALLRQGATSRSDDRRHHADRRLGWPARGTRADPRAPSASHRRDTDAQGGRAAGGDRPGAASPPAVDDRDLCEGRSRRAAHAGTPVARSAVMSGLGQHLGEYLAVRRALGYKLERAGKLLTQFIAWLDDRGQSTITTERALEWAKLPAATGSNWHAHRLSVIRGFAAHLHAIDPTHEVPPADLLVWRSRRRVPYLYADSEVRALMDAASIIPTAHRAATLRALIGLLAVTGMRIGEAIRLDRSDIDYEHELLVVRDSKFGKSREVALHLSTITALRRYLRRRDRPAPAEPTAALFTSAAGTRLTYCNVHLAFKRIAAHAGLEPRSPECRPRPHDLRHTFAVNTVLDAYRSGEDVRARLPLLSTYLGHVNPGSTYW